MNRGLKRIEYIPTIAISIKTSRPLTFEQGRGLRGCIANILRGNVLVHNHNDSGLIYSYPRIQYKVIDGEAKIIGLAEGAELLKEMPTLRTLSLGKQAVAVEKIELQESTEIIGISNSVEKYHFLTPWLALNEKNYQQYLRSGNNYQRKKLLEKVIIGNIISMAKGLNFTVPGPLYGKLENYQEIETSLKGMPMLGFYSIFSVNFQIPEYWGIGKSVSRGFGTISKVK